MAPGGLAVLLQAAALVVACAGKVESSCNAGQSAAECSAALLRRGSGSGLSLIQHRGTLSVTSALRVNATAIAAHIRSRNRQPQNIAIALNLGLAAIDDSAKHFMNSPPHISKGVTTLASGLFKAVEVMVPEDVTKTLEFKDFQAAWTTTFVELPSMVESIEEDLRAFAREGAEDKLVRAVNAFLAEAAAVVSRMLPEETGDQIAQYLGAVADAFDGLGDAIAAFSEGEVPGAIEAVYKGLKAATRDLAPQQVQSDDTYREVVGILDVTVGNLSKHVLEFKKLLAESNVCWKRFYSRKRHRPNLCEDEYTWDGEQWCMWRQVPPYTIQSLRSGKYLNVHRGSTEAGANVVVWNNPDSKHSQWRLNRLDDGSYTIQNINAHKFLHVYGGSRKRGANVDLSYSPSRNSSHWRLIPVYGGHGVYNIRNVRSRRYVNLENGGSWSGTNVQMWSGQDSPDNQWRIAAAWGGEVFDIHQGPAGPAKAPSLLQVDQAVSAKRPSGALPARCKDTHEKRGAWCYTPCRDRYEADGSKCKALCAAGYPADSPLMCGKSPALLSQAVLKMISETVSKVISVANLQSEMQASGNSVAAELKGTMQALIDMGKPFAHPTCPE